jgi:hypothetical protein
LGVCFEADDDFVALDEFGCSHFFKSYLRGETPPRLRIL